MCYAHCSTISAHTTPSHVWHAYLAVSLVCSVQRERDACREQVEHAKLEALRCKDRLDWAAYQLEGTQ